jgi:hypothetical protein
VWEAKIAVSSAYVATVVVLVVSRSAVYKRYNIGPSTVPWGTPECMGNKSVYSLPCLESDSSSRNERTCFTARDKISGK